MKTNLKMITVSSICAVALSTAAATANVSSPFGGVNVSTPFGGFGISTPFGGANVATPFGGFGFSTPLGGANVSTPFGGFGFSTPLGGANVSTPFGGFGISTPFGGANVATPFGGFGFSTPLGGANVSTPFGGFGFSTPLGGANVSTPFGGFGISTPFVNFSDIATTGMFQPQPFGGLVNGFGITPSTGSMAGDIATSVAMGLLVPGANFFGPGMNIGSGMAGQPIMTQGVSPISCAFGGETLLAQSVDSCENAGGAVNPAQMSYTTACDINGAMVMAPSNAACLRANGTPSQQ